MLDSISTLLLLAIAILLFTRYSTQKKEKKKENPLGLPYPPGPKGLPIIANILDVPASRAWLTYSHWQKQYGDLVYLSALGQDIVVINSAKVANDLLEKRSHKYSDRPDMTMITMMQWDFNMTFKRYGDEWRAYRKIFHQAFRPEAALAYRPLQLEKVHETLQRLLESPKDFSTHIKNLPASAAMHAVYGHKIAPKDDRFVTLAEETVGMLSDAVTPGAAVVNAFPILRHLPDWIPGMRFKRVAKKCSRLCSEMQNVPFEWVGTNMAVGAAIPSWTTELLEDGKQEEKVIKSVAATAFAGGADTSASAMMTFLIAMMLYTKTQIQAQAEIDRVVGPGRLPTWDDRDSLPYVEALYREVLRWQPVAPLGVAHATTEDDYYDGMFIPKGAAVVPNIWAMTHDERFYSEPDRFMPERFLTAEGKVSDSVILAFGFGRRVCVGRHSADAIVWALIVSVLSVFDIAKAKDEAGNDIEVSLVYTDSLISHPLPFACSITPRSEETRMLIGDITKLKN